MLLLNTNRLLQLLCTNLSTIQLYNDQLNAQVFSLFYVSIYFCLTCFGLYTTSFQNSRNLQHKISSTINHILTNLRQIYYTPEIKQRFKDGLGNCSPPDDGSVSLETYGI
jgi:hypothetical protein